MPSLNSSLPYHFCTLLTLTHTSPLGSTRTRSHIAIAVRIIALTRLCCAERCPCQRRARPWLGDALEHESPPGSIPPLAQTLVLPVFQEVLQDVLRYLTSIDHADFHVQVRALVYDLASHE
jgi:hypothetical protein